ncbi:MAG: hypothetical protein ACPKPY_05265 [Nitrososphaeraceae archaeon]
MIGTPNDGSPLADMAQNIPPIYRNLFCFPAVYDLTTYSEATKVPNNPHTNYYTIAGD